MEKNVTDEVREANRANSAASTGPATEPGKRRSSMNALKHGRYAKRLDPVKRLLEDLSAEEEAEREALRADVVERYQPPDAFAEQQAEELADLQFELRRLEGVKQVIWQRERELLELEQRRRALRLKQDGVGACAQEIYDRGLVNQPDSPGKFREMLRILEVFVHTDHEIKIGDIRSAVNRLYGDGERAWRGIRLRWALSDANKAESDEDRRQAGKEFGREVKRELEYVREELAICELEQGPLSAAGQAARLLEVMSSRKWSWIRQQENFLMRSIDRKVRVLMDLRREAETAQRRAAAKSPADENPNDGNPPEGAAGDGQPASDQIVEEVERASGPEPEGTEAVASASPAEAADLGPAGLFSEKSGQNQGTKPPSDLVSATVWEPIETELFEVRAVYGNVKQIAEILQENTIDVVSPDETLLN
jgi:hypothetical protein